VYGSPGRGKFGKEVPGWLAESLGKSMSDPSNHLETRDDMDRVCTNDEQDGEISSGDMQPKRHRQ
jgi:hypothetical protein